MPAIGKPIQSQNNSLQLKSILLHQSYERNALRRGRIECPVWTKCLLASLSHTSICNSWFSPLIKAPSLPSAGNSHNMDRSGWPSLVPPTDSNKLSNLYSGQVWREKFRPQTDTPLTNSAVALMNHAALSVWGWGSKWEGDMGKIGAVEHNPA